MKFLPLDCLKIKIFFYRPNKHFQIESNSDMIEQKKKELIMINGMMKFELRPLAYIMQCPTKVIESNSDMLDKIKKELIVICNFSFYVK
jgi:hypothetical protein